jgi:hypothetical protein
MSANAVPAPNSSARMVFTAFIINLLFVDNECAYR